MPDTNNDLTFVKQILKTAEGNQGYPAIYFLWGVIVLAGYGIAEFHIDWISRYWLIAAPVGMVISAVLGVHQDRTRGQHSKRLGRQHMEHFALMVVFIFVAVFTAQYQAILLIIGLGYCLAGIHFDRIMLWIGILTLATYLAVSFGFITSNLYLGVILAAGFFVAAWSTARPYGSDPNSA